MALNPLLFIQHGTESRVDFQLLPVAKRKLPLYWSINDECTHCEPSPSVFFLRRNQSASRMAHGILASERRPTASGGVDDLGRGTASIRRHGQTVLVQGDGAVVVEPPRPGCRRRRLFPAESDGCGVDRRGQERQNDERQPKVDALHCSSCCSTQTIDADRVAGVFLCGSRADRFRSSHDGKQRFSFVSIDPC